MALLALPGNPSAAWPQARFLCGSSAGRQRYGGLFNEPAYDFLQKRSKKTITEAQVDVRLMVTGGQRPLEAQDRFLRPVTLVEHVPGLPSIVGK